MAPVFQDRLAALARFPLVADVRGQGLLGCIECVVDADNGDALALDKSVGVMIDQHCQDNGLVLRPLINMCVFSPPLIISEEEIHKLFDIFELAIKLTSDELTRNGHHFC